MSRKHAHRADNAPASRRYVRSVVQRARDEIISAIVYSPKPLVEPSRASRQAAIAKAEWEDLATISANGVTITPERLARYVGDDA